MDNLISRQAAIEYFMTNTNWHDEDGYEIHDAEDKLALLKSYFAGIPSVQPEQKVGTWIVDGHHLRCSACGVCMCSEDREGNRIALHFCPNCGAKMEEQDANGT